MPEHDDFAVRCGQLQQGAPDELGLFQFFHDFGRTQGVSGELAGPGFTCFIHAVFERKLRPALAAAEIVVAKIQGNSPEPGRELGLRCIVAAFGEHPAEGFLGEVFGTVQVAGHTGAQSLDGLFPAVDELREGRVIVGILHAPHGLLVGDGKGPGHQSLLDETLTGWIWFGTFFRLWQSRGGGRIFRLPCPMSSNLFPSGPWTGFYNHRPGDNHRMDLRLEFRSGRMTGDGTDDIGPFIITGQYDEATLECSWTKSYVSAHDVQYRGFREGKGIWGTWEIGKQFRGGFQIWPTGLDAETRSQLQEWAEKQVEMTPSSEPATVELRRPG
jgi:hypothetical protein